MKNQNYKQLHISLVIILLMSGPISAQNIRSQTLDIHSYDETREQNTGLSKNPTLEDYIDHAIRNNKRIAASYSEWQSSVHNISISKKLPDPSVGFGVFLSNVETAVGPQEYKIALMQGIPWFGKRSLAGKIQSKKAEIAAEKFQAEVNLLLLQVTDIYLDNYLLEKSIEITDGNIELIKNWENVVRSKYASAKAGHPDVIKTQIELMKLEDDRLTLLSKKEPLIKRFSALMDDGSVTSIQVSDSLDFRQFDDDIDQLWIEIQENNPQLLSAGHSLEMADLMVKRSRLNYFPDFGIGIESVGTGDRIMNGVKVDESGKDPLVAKIEFKLPVWFGKTHKQVQAAESEKMASSYKLIDLENKLRAELEQVLFEIDNSKRKTDLYQNGLIPKSIESLRATEKAYISETLDFINLVDAQRRYLQFLLEYESSKVYYLKALARLEVLVGRML